MNSWARAHMPGRAHTRDSRIPQICNHFNIY